MEIAYSDEEVFRILEERIDSDCAPSDFTVIRGELMRIRVNKIIKVELESC